MIYGSQNFAVTFPGIRGSSEGVDEEEVRGREWSKARMRVIFHPGCKNQFT